MVVNRRTFLVAFSLAVFFVFSTGAGPNTPIYNAAYACSCMIPESANDSLQTSAAVFSGKAVKIEKRHSDDLAFSSMDPVLVTFDVDRVWKGENESSITIQTRQSSASCGYSFEEDSNYLVYAQRNGEMLDVSLCSRTSLVSSAAEDISELGIPNYDINDMQEFPRSDPISSFLSPLKQLQSGILPVDIQCKSDLVLVFKNGNDSFPACVTPETKDSLIERGWADESKTLILSKQVNVFASDSLAQKITDSANEFALDFYRQESENKKENIFFSSPSIYGAFSILHEGARGDTAEEMQNVFGFLGDDDRRIGFYSYMDALGQKNNDENALSMANALWLANDFVPLPEYIKTAKTFYSSSVDSVNFATDEGVNRINDWTKLKTQEKIKELLKPGSTDPTTRMVITNAIHFEGSWEHPFDVEDTYQTDFEVDSENKVTVQMMTYPHKMSIKHMATENMQMLQMPYKGNDFSMLILLPSSMDDMQSVEGSLTLENLNLWKDSLSSLRGIVIHIPKFTLETEYDLTESLPEMGMPSVFGPADLSGITGHKGLFVSEAIHKAFVDVNEKGTEAAAATAVVLDESGGAEFRADHPFIVMIQDNETGSILFMGKVVDPTK